MSGKKIDVRYIAHLARIKLSEAEIETFQGQLEQIVAYVEKIGRLDVSGIEPTSHAHTVANVFREDVVRQGADRDRFLANAPDRIEDQFKVPKIVE